MALFKRKEKEEITFRQDPRMVLKKNIYSDFGPKGRARPFGLAWCQLRGLDKLSHNGSWYNSFGELIGFGDIGPIDLFNIQKEIPSAEMFIIVAERHAPPGDVPGPDVVAEYAWYVITRTMCLIIDNGAGYSEGKPGEFVNHSGIDFMIMDPKGLRKLMGDSMRKLLIEVPKAPPVNPQWNQRQQWEQPASRWGNSSGRY